MREFFELFEILKRKDNHYRLHIGYTSVCEYSMQIDYGFPEDFETVFFIQQINPVVLFAKGIIEVEKILCEKFGGY